MQSSGRMAERLGTALQKLLQRFESAFDLRITSLLAGFFCALLRNEHYCYKTRVSTAKTPVITAITSLNSAESTQRKVKKSKEKESTPTPGFFGQIFGRGITSAKVRFSEEVDFGVILALKFRWV